MRGHTPGPWRAEPQDIFGDVNIVLEDDSEDSRAIAAAISNLRPDHEIIANADLIAAAPDMFETLSLLRAALAEMDAELHAQNIGVIDLTIAKARGETV